MPQGGSHARQTTHPCYAVTAPGLEAITASELRSLGFEPAPPEPGGVPFEADLEGIFRANLHLRTATRVLMRLAQFRATAFHELERCARTVDFAAVVPDGAAVTARVTCKKSRLYHSDAVAERVVLAVKRSIPSATVKQARGAEAEGNEEEIVAARLLTVRFVHDVCTISADTSGEPLHRRGHRLATAKAPLRETLAAGVLLALGYDGTHPIVDPMCGAGTFPLEAALIARRIAPGLSRSFACESFREAPHTRIAALRDRARGQVLPRAPSPIVASDRDDGAIAATRGNLTRAGVDGDVTVAQQALSALETLGSSPGLLVVNPPYGERIGESAPLRNLYAQLGNVARAKCPGWTVGLLVTDRALEAQVKLPLEEILRFKNGGIAVRLVRAKVG